MRKKLNVRLIAIVLALCMFLGSGPAVLLAQATEDIEGHWAEEAIIRWVDRGIVKGYEDGTFDPHRFIKRAESEQTNIEKGSLIMCSNTFICFGVVS